MKDTYLDEEHLYNMYLQAKISNERNLQEKQDLKAKLEQAQARIKEVETENERLFNTNLETITNSDFYVLSKQLEKENQELKDQLFLLEKELHHLKNAGT